MRNLPTVSLTCSMLDALTPPAVQESPAAADLRTLMAENPLPAVAPGTVDPDHMGGDEPARQAHAALAMFNAALAGDDANAIRSCFLAEQAYWKDNLALTYHLRTLSSPGVIAAVLLETKRLRGAVGPLEVTDACQFHPLMNWIDCAFSFRTRSPPATCSGKVLLLPVQDSDGAVQWKIWILSTRLRNLDVHPENELLLRGPRRNLSGVGAFEVDVVIIGGGNSAIALAARLKTLGVESAMVERNARAGDNWALRYDCLRFHVPTSFCELPYMPYEGHLRTGFLSRDDLANQVKRYVDEFHLNLITEATVTSTTYDTAAGRWTVKFQTPAGETTAVAKHVVQATGVGSQKPNLPALVDKSVYDGLSIHSAQYTNPAVLKERGVESVIVVGSANTAFDVLEDCHAAGLATTMVARSPTYLCPIDYITHPLSLGSYDAGVDAADDVFLSLPIVVDAALGKGLLAMFAAAEPDRYSSLIAAGFPVIDSADPNCALMHNLLERAGGHYVDIGGTRLIAEGKAGVKSNVDPVAFTKQGLRFSDGSTLDADAVIWCTGFRDADVREVAADVLGGGGPSDKEGVLGPHEIAARMDATWGVDEEGEMRGVWKRQLHLDNFWVMGGYTQLQRWHSWTLALQIKAALEGILPDAYRDTPAPIM